MPSLLCDVSLLLPSGSQGWIIIKFYHFLDDLILRSVEVGVVLELARVVAALLGHPLLLTGIQVSLELAVVFANYSLCRIVEAIAYVIGSFRNILSTDIVADERHSVGTKPLELFSVESPILDCAVVPFLVLELEVVVEEVLAFDQLATVPLCDVATL